MLRTLEDAVTCGLALFAIAIVPAAILRAWWPVLRERFAPVIMSRVWGAAGAIEPVADRLPTTVTEVGQGIATPGNAVNEPLTGNAPLPEAVRDIIRFQAKIEALAELIGAGKVPQAEGIEIVFHCKRSGRPESPYARARAAIQVHLASTRPEYRAYPGELAKFAEAANGHEE
jgi:hypothetical protein